MIVRRLTSDILLYTQWRESIRSRKLKNFKEGEQSMQSKFSFDKPSILMILHHQMETGPSISESFCLWYHDIITARSDRN